MTRHCTIQCDTIRRSIALEFRIRNCCQVRSRWDKIAVRYEEIRWGGFPLQCMFLFATLRVKTQDFCVDQALSNALPHAPYMRPETDWRAKHVILFHHTCKDGSFELCLHPNSLGKYGKMMWLVDSSRPLLGFSIRFPEGWNDSQQHPSNVPWKTPPLLIGRPKVWPQRPGGICYMTFLGAFYGRGQGGAVYPIGRNVEAL